MNTNTTLLQSLHISPATIEKVEAAGASLEKPFREAAAVAEHNQYKILRAMQQCRVSEGHFAGTNGYGYNDRGREGLEEVYAQVFAAEAALVRPQMVSGTHALATALFGNLRPGDRLFSPTGAPYDTLHAVIGLRPAVGSLAEMGVEYAHADLLPSGQPDYDAIGRAFTDKARPIKMAAIQRSKGYAWRPSFTIEELAALIAFIRERSPQTLIMVDNCYGEFVETREPIEAGADLAVGSLIKNPGGGLAPAGGYIVGKRAYVEAAAARLTAPGLGMEVGSSMGLSATLLQGLFLAPHVVAAALQGAMLAAEVFAREGYGVLPAPTAPRADIVQAIQLGCPDKLLAFCRGIQQAAPVDSFVTPVADAMPGYEHAVVMAAGAFVQGSSIELSADAPLKPPYTVYFQGGLTYSHAKYGVMCALENVRGIDIV